MKANKTGKTQSKRNTLFWIGAALCIVLTIMVLVSCFWTPWSPTAMNGKAKLQAPSAVHLLGTDNLGRDVFSRVLKGAGASFFVGVCVVLIGSFCGTVLGSICGYFGGLADEILTRVCDTITAFPAVLLALVAISLIGGGTLNLILVLGILFIPSFARVVRTEVARIRTKNYVQSARLMGAGHFRIILLHILPNVLPVLLPAMTIGFNNAVLSEASMSFLGIGVLPPQISLGAMLSDSQTYLRNAPWYALSSGSAIALIILSVSLLSEGMQQAQDRS